MSNRLWWPGWVRDAHQCFDAHPTREILGDQSWHNRAGHNQLHCAGRRTRRLGRGHRPRPAAGSWPSRCRCLA